MRACTCMHEHTCMQMHAHVHVCMHSNILLLVRYTGASQPMKRENIIARFEKCYFVLILGYTQYQNKVDNFNI